MNAIINGKRYNTETATLIASYSRGGGGDFSAIDEGLYRTPRGTWFTAGSGGPQTSYARSCGQNSWRGGSAIRPLTDQLAAEWLERREHTAALEHYFADTLEDA